MHRSEPRALRKAQSATEYLLTYSWAFLIAAVIIAALYFFVFAPAGITPTTCTFSSGPHCQDLVLGSSASLSKMALLLTNTNPFPIISPKITANITGFAPIQGTCIPYFILPGGAVICNATITPAIAQSSLSAGSFIFSYIPCPGGNATLCSSNQRQSFSGSFNIHTSPLLSPITVNIILSAQNSSQIALSSVKDKVTANVKMLGTPLSGATVNFTTTGSAVISPSASSTDGSGNAVTYIYDTVAENVLVSASFANATSNTILHFLPAVCFTVSLGSASPSANALTIDGVGYSSFPVNLCYAQGSSHSYSFASTVAGSAGIQYAFSSASGCGASGQSGTITASTNCTLTGTYTLQYLLTTSSSPSAGGTATPSSQYYNSGTQVTLGETPNGGYFFLSWTGSGTGSYSGNTAAPTIGMNGVITQQANFYSTSTSTTTSTSTSSTTTTVYPVTYNPTSGTYRGDVIYTVSTQLAGAVIATNMISVNSGITLDVCGNYIEANVMLYNLGTITTSCSSLARTSTYFGVSLSMGANGLAGNSGSGTLPGAGGAGGLGGGIVEIYAANIVNSGSINANGHPGSSGSGASAIDGQTTPSGGGGGGGAGGHGGTLFLAYTTLSGSGTTQSLGGVGGSGGAGGIIVISFDQQTSSSSGGSGTIAGGGGGGGGNGEGCCSGATGGSGGSGGNPNGGSGGSGGSYGFGIGSNGSPATPSSSNSGSVITRTWP
ncbi:MAG: Ig-like domain-containing protein [Candidatus Micrarchaeota archaeon]|nr:Ig-like domain-containing protein [Candidatus Micrarchaeota archaeon]